MKGKWVTIERLTKRTVFVREGTEARLKDKRELNIMVEGDSEFRVFESPEDELTQLQWAVLRGDIEAAQRAMLKGYGAEKLKELQNKANAEKERNAKLI